MQGDHRHLSHTCMVLPPQSDLCCIDTAATPFLHSPSHPEESCAVADWRDFALNEKAEVVMIMLMSSEASLLLAALMAVLSPSPPPPPTVFVRFFADVCETLSECRLIGS